MSVSTPSPVPASQPWLNRISRSQRGTATFVCRCSRVKGLSATGFSSIIARNSSSLREGDREIHYRKFSISIRSLFS